MNPVEEQVYSSRIQQAKPNATLHPTQTQQEREYAQDPSLSAHLSFWEAEDAAAGGSGLPVSSSSGPRALFASDGPSSSFLDSLIGAKTRGRWQGRGKRGCQLLC